MYRNKLYLLLINLLPLTAFAQQPVEMADAMRSNGKIFVIVAIIVIILAGLFIYLFSIDKKVAKLEKKLTEKFPKTK